MEDEQEVEEFGITDYDLMQGFGMGLGYRKRRMTKEQAIYGMWAEKDSDDEDSYVGRKTKDYSKPLNFVSGGIVQKGKKDKKEDAKTEDEDHGSSSDSGQENELGSKAPHVQSKKLYKGTGLVKNKQTFQASQEFARKLKGVGGKKFGTWEKHTKGFGMKMLQKMGYEPGKGLGKESQGIVMPVEAFKREGRGALGLYGSERTQQSKELRPQIDEEEEEEKKFREELHQWKKTDQGAKKPKYVYKTAEDVKASGSTKKGPSISLAHTKIKVVDMTGPETKILTGYGSLTQQHAKPGEVPPTTSVRDEEAVFSMPELTYNLNLLVDMAESEIIQTDRQLRHERDLVVNLKHEREKMSAQLEQEEKQINKLIEVMELIDRCKKHSLSSNHEPMSLSLCEDIFRMLQEEHYEEYRMYDLSTLAIPLVFPLIRAHFQSWNPLANPTHGMDVIKRWKDLLQSDKSTGFTLNTQGNIPDSANMDIYDRLIWEVWMPFLRSTISAWHCQYCDPMIELIEHWLPVLPSWIMDNIIDQLILPRLQVNVDSWNPLTDTVPIHAWIHPWLPLIGQRLEPLYAPIRYKLASALTNWHPSDPSAKMILQPWSNVFSKGSMDAFILRSIYPKLSQCLGEFVINPHQQHLDPFHWVMSWKDIIPRQHFVSLLDKHFFPRWIQVLRGWLSSNPNYDEVTKWYIGWKSMFEEDLLSNPTVKAQFNRALDVMNQAVTSPGGYLQPGARENIAYLTSTERRKEAEAAVAAAEKQKVEAARSVAAQNVPSNFKDLVQKTAEDNNVLFMPIPNRRHEGKTLYSVGKATIYIDRGVAFVQSQGSWKPVSLQNLMILAK